MLRSHRAFGRWAANQKGIWELSRRRQACFAFTVVDFFKHELMRVLVGKAGGREENPGKGLAGWMFIPHFHFECQMSVRGTVHRRQNRTLRGGRTKG